jgi:hypothetical protein
MADLPRLIIAILASLFKSRAELEAEKSSLRQQISCFCGGCQSVSMPAEDPTALKFIVN